MRTTPLLPHAGLETDRKEDEERGAVPDHLCLLPTRTPRACGRQELPPGAGDPQQEAQRKTPQGGRARKELAGKVDHPRETFLNLRGNDDGERGGGLGIYFRSGRRKGQA